MLSTCSARVEHMYQHVFNHNTTSQKKDYSPRGVIILGKSLLNRETNPIDVVGFGS